MCDAGFKPVLNLVITTRQDMTGKLKHRPVVIIIRDGWGANPYPQWNHANAVYLAKTPVADRLMADYPHVLVKTNGRDVGLPGTTMGNSEVGHQNIGAGRIVEQEITRITGRIEDGSFFNNPVLCGAFEHACQTDGRVHLIGLCSDGRVHSELLHLFALIDLSAKMNFPGDRVFIHAFLDGRDTPPNSGLGYIERIEEKCRSTGVNPIASVCGRFYAMDRDQRWQRIQLAYDMLIGRQKHTAYPCFDSATQAVQHYYEHPTNDSMKGDEFVTASTISPPPSRGGIGGGASHNRITDGDSVIFFNYRGDRPRELVKAFTLDNFPSDLFSDQATSDVQRTVDFDRERKLNLYFATMTAYESGLPVHVAFEKPPPMQDILGAYLSSLSLQQYRSAETEKFPHVTFFFNDYREKPFDREDRCLIPSPRDVKTYDEKPTMSAYPVTEKMLQAIASNKYDAMVLNYANGDMVGHTGNLQAAIRAVETVDECVGRVVDAVTEKSGALIVTADHGNCEQMIDPQTGGPHTAHTTYPVELIVVADAFRARALRSGGRLADIAPTALQLLGLEKPQSMTGQSLILPS